MKIDFVGVIELGFDVDEIKWFMEVNWECVVGKCCVIDCKLMDGEWLVLL